jgi:Rrf2 family protein
MMKGTITEDGVLLPQTAEYAVRAVLHIAAHQGDGAVRVRDTAQTLRVPRNYLSKTLYQLARAGVLISARGPCGGFRLAVPADELSLDRIISTFAAAGGRRCLLGHGTCGETPDCAVHAQWAPIATQLREFFGATTIADLLPAPSHFPSRAHA